MEFVTWRKIARLNRDWEITEKVDGTNGILFWTPIHDGQWDSGKVLAKVDDLYLFAGSRTRWLTPQEDNFGFAKWAKDNAEDLVMLGQGRHFGEWYGAGIQRRYDLDHKRFALFEQRYAEDIDSLPKDVDVVPVIWTQDGAYLNNGVATALDILRSEGSYMVPGFMNPEGIVVRHKQEGTRFKVLLVGDEMPKSVAECAGGCGA